MRTQRARRCSRRRGGLCAELRGPSRLRPRPATPTATPAAGARRPGGLSGPGWSHCRAEARATAGGAAGLPAAHSGERPRGPGGPGGGRRCAAGGGRSAGRTGLSPRGGEGDSGAGASLPGSRGTSAGNRGAPGHPRWEAVTNLPAVGPAIWDRLNPVAPGKGPRDYVQASFHLGARPGSLLLPSAPRPRLFLM